MQIGAQKKQACKLEKPGIWRSNLRSREQSFGLFLTPHRHPRLVFNAVQTPSSVTRCSDSLCFNHILTLKKKCDELSHLSLIDSSYRGPPSHKRLGWIHSAHHCRSREGVGGSDLEFKLFALGDSASLLQVETKTLGACQPAWTRKEAKKCVKMWDTLNLSCSRLSPVVTSLINGMDSTCHPKIIRDLVWPKHCIKMHQVLPRCSQQQLSVTM